MASTRGGNVNANIPWLDQDVVVVPGLQHALPEHPEKILPNFSPDRKDYTDDHINTFMLVVKLMNVKFECIVCGLFPYTFEGRASTWYFPLAQCSITT